MGSEPEDAVRVQMENLGQAAAFIAAGEEKAVLLGIDDFLQQLDRFERGAAPDGWSTQEIVDHVGELCERADLTWWMVI
jgi:hypothetical protein